MRKITWKAGRVALLLLVLPVAAWAQSNPYYRDADPAYERNFQANVDAYKKQMTGGHHEHAYHSYNAEEVAALENKARGGDKFALRTLGDGYASGNGFAKNEQKALEWYEMGARLGHSEFFARVGDLYREHYKPEQSTFQKMMSYVSPENNASTIQRDNRVALAWYEKGRVWDDGASLLALSDFYAQGLGGVEVDEELARKYQIRGAQLLDRQTRMQEREFEAQARAYAAKITPFNPQNGQNNDSTQVINRSGLQTTLGGRTCYYSPVQQQMDGYDFLFSAECEGIVNYAALKEQVALPGMLCDVAQQGNSTSFALKCNAVGGEVITIAGLECSLRSEEVSKGFTAVYGAYCQGDAKPTHDKVAYNGLECIPNRVYTEGGKQYTLYCNPPEAKQETPVKQAAGSSKLVSIGNFSCTASEQGGAGSSRRINYNVNCGGVTPAAKVGPQVPKLIPFGEYLCDVLPVEGRENIDFTMDCKK